MQFLLTIAQKIVEYLLYRSPARKQGENIAFHANFSIPPCSERLRLFEYTVLYYFKFIIQSLTWGFPLVDMLWGSPQGPQNGPK